MQKTKPKGRDGQEGFCRKVAPHSAAPEHSGAYEAQADYERLYGVRSEDD